VSGNRGVAEYDLVVIGGGPGGYVAAIRAAQLGMNVACVEREPVLGGTCLRIGCIPSKALLESSELYAHARDGLAGHGVRADAVSLDLDAMLRRKDATVRALTRGIDGLFRKHEVTRYLGHGRIARPGEVAVDGGAETTALRAGRILVATGSVPAALPGIAMDGDRIGTSTQALAYAEVPAHLVVVGAGYIGLELGSVWRRLGAQVTVLESLDRILPGMDAEIAREARRVLEKQGLAFRLGTQLTAARVEGDGCVVQCAGAEPLRCDRVLVAVGRRPVTDGLGLESVGIAVDAQGRIPVDGRFATAAEGIFAVGDVVAGPMLAHKAMDEGVACVEGMAGQPTRVDRDTIPAVVYTAPEIAAVGRTEEQLREAGVDYRKGVFPFLASGRARILGQTEGRVKVLADRRTDRVLGVHILGPRAGDLIAEATVAMAFGASSEDVARTCHAHPTLPEALREAALAVDGRALHL
jgi:dihydrolipoamide dehydrogenase